MQGYTIGPLSYEIVQNQDFPPLLPETHVLHFLFDSFCFFRNTQQEGSYAGVQQNTANPGHAQVPPYFLSRTSYTACASVRSSRGICTNQRISSVHAPCRVGINLYPFNALSTSGHPWPKA